MTSDASWSNKARQISELERPDHFFLREEDECYYFGDYTPRKGFDHSDTNQFVSNLKKPVRFRGQYPWRYKQQAIRIGGQLIAHTLNRDAAQRVVLVPIPPSKPADHPEYDDRMSRLCNGAAPFQTSELLSTVEAREPAHHQDGGRSVEAVYETLQLHEDRYCGQPICVLVDDVLTTGSSFRASQQKLLELEGVEQVIGIFMARCAWPKIEFPPIDLDDF